MLPKHLLPLFTHLSQDSSAADQNTVFLLRNGCFDEEERRAVNPLIEVANASNGEGVTSALEFNYYDFTTFIKATSPVECWSSSNLYDRVTYKRFRVIANLFPPYDEWRYIEFDTTPEKRNPVVIEEVEQSLNPGLHQTTTSEVYLNSQFRRSLGLPNALGTVSYLTGVPLTVEEKIDLTAIASAITTAAAFLPSHEAGWLSSLRVDGDMSISTCESLAWGFLLAAAYQDLGMIVSGFKELLRQAKRRSWLVEENGEWVLNSETDPKAGFALSFDLTGEIIHGEVKEVATNAFLGYAICTALSVLSDRPDLLEGDLKGEWATFRSEFLLALEALALFVSRSISPVTHWAAYCEQAGLYAYDTPSLTASYLADIFLSSFLSFKYNSFVHERVTRLRLTLLTASPTLEDPVYEVFQERDYSGDTYAFEPVFTDDANQQDYIYLLNYSARALWLSIQRDGSQLSDALLSYDTYRQSFLTEQADTLLYPDSLVLLACSVFQRLTEDDLSEYDNSLDLTLVVGEWYPTWSVGFLTSIGAALEPAALFTPYAVEPDLSERALPSINLWVFQLGVVAVIEQQVLACLPELCAVDALSSQAYTTALLLELRRLMPFGLKWFASELVDQTTSVIGGLLYAEAQTYYRWALDINVVSKAASATTAISEQAQQWFSWVYGLDIIASDGHLRQRFLLNQGLSIKTPEEFVSYLQEYLGLTAQLSRPAAPSFCVLKSLKVSEDSLDNYTEPTSTLDLSDPDVVFSELQYYSIFFKRRAARWVARTVPGFPIRPDDALLGATVVTPEVFLTTPVADVLVQDGLMLVYPLANYLMQISLDLTGWVPADLTKTAARVLPVGLSVKYSSQLLLDGDE